MPTDMKRAIAEAVQTLLIERHVKKLTVKDIVEQCHITRQAFYYHFEGIPELLRWMIDSYFEQVMGEALAQEDGEAGLRCFFVMAINSAPYVEHGIKSNYGEELKRLLCQSFERYFALASQRKNFYPNCTHSQLQIILRYHDSGDPSLGQPKIASAVCQNHRSVKSFYTPVILSIHCGISAH